MPIIGLYQNVCFTGKNRGWPCQAVQLLFFFLNKILQVKHKVDNVVPSMIMAMPITLRMYTTNKEVKPILWLSAVEFSLSQINDN